MIMHVVPGECARREQMINKGAGGDKLRQSEKYDGEASAARQPERQSARRANGQIKADRERNRDEVVLGEAGEHDQERSTQESAPGRRPAYIGCEASKHQRFSQGLRVIDSDPGGGDQIGKNQPAFAAKNGDASTAS